MELRFRMGRSRTVRFGVVLLDIFIETHEVYAAITVVDVKQCLRQRFS